MVVNADIYKDNADSCSSDRKVDSQIKEEFSIWDIDCWKKSDFFFLIILVKVTLAGLQTKREVIIIIIIPHMDVGESILHFISRHLFLSFFLFGLLNLGLITRPQPAQ